jgi:hypothetical protein
MPEENRKTCDDWVENQMHPVQDQGHYYLFRHVGVDIDMTICMPNDTDDIFKEDERFCRIRNACFLTAHPKLVEALYRRLKNIIEGYPEKQHVPRLIARLNAQLKDEYLAFDSSTVASPGPDYLFSSDWQKVRHLVHELELAHPILRAWITADAEDPELPADPAERYQGKHWDVIIDCPTFAKGDRSDWGKGWNGMDKQDWQRELLRKHFYMVLTELSSLETEREGEVV